MVYVAENQREKPHKPLWLSKTQKTTIDGYYIVITSIIYIKEIKNKEKMTKITIMAIYKKAPQHVIRRWLKKLGLNRAFRKGMYEYVDNKTLRNLERAQLQCGLCFFVGSTEFLKFYQIF